MSWLNFNESLNTIKGQLTNLASGVLAEGIVGNSENDPRKDFEINDCNVRQNAAQNENHWSWDASSNESTSKRDTTLVQDLRNKVDLLENEKKELVHSLEQLDVDHQQTTAELVALRDNLQKRHDELSADFERLKREYGEVLTENMEKTKQIELIRNGEAREGDLDSAKLQAECHTIRESYRKVEKENEELLAKLSGTTRISRETDRRTWEKFKGEKNAIRSMLAKVKEDFLSLTEDVRGISEVQRSLQRFQRCQNVENSKRHVKYLGIITECLEKYTSVDPASALSSIITGEDPQIVEFANEVENLLKLLIDFKSKTESLEEEICGITREKSKVVNEKNFEIEKLLQNSEILSQEVIAKTQALKDYETECNELMKNNDLLILELENFKNSRLQTISETNEENMLLMESQLENANKKIEDMELIITDLETSKQETNEEVQTELDYIKRQLNITGQELSETKTDHQELKIQCSRLEEEKQSLKQALDKARVDYENMEYKCNEAFVALESVREENEELKRSTGEDKVEQFEAVVSEQRDRLSALEELTKEQANEIQSYTERLQRAKITETGAKLQIDTMGKELQSSQEARRMLEEKLDHLQREYTAAVEERSTREELQNHVALLESQLEQSSAARNELAQLLTQKHDENVRYHAEIERLASETGPELIANKDREIEKLTDQNNFLREKCEVMAQNLLQEQANVKKIVGEQSSASALTKELERLRMHLVEVEEMYTQELVQAEQKNKEMQAKVNEIEAREKNSNYVYTSANIRANQQVETLQTQLQLVGNQRDELRVKISDIEDENNRHVAALTNLQLVLEQFQKEKEKDVFNETERIRRQIVLEQRVQDALREENGNLRAQLDESKQGLQAAARLTDQLEKSKKHINALKEEVAKLQEKLQVRDSSYRELHAQADTKIDKSLIKNLIIGYVSSSANDQKQILKIIATVLDFNKKENEKVSLSKQQHSGWLASILSSNAAANDQNQQSLSAAFVRFLEDESRPKVLPNLLASNRSEASGSSASSTPPPSQSPLILSEVVLPTFVDFAKSRNSSAILKDVLKDNT
uniref:GRIP domain-containing protein n=2 Tax=Photinus pyralis TaxID=7054 RepID=A0A1Y1MJS9_PHOPY